jgi:uncharacterized membrane-anchored protein YitT (DUF2179 family)
MVWKNEVKNLVKILVAAFLYAAGISLFLDPNNLAPGGITGISVILNRVIGVETGTIYFLANVPIVIFGIWKFGLTFMLKTAYAIAAISWFTNILSGYGALTTEPLLAALAGGVMIALGIGVIFKSGATTGGIDIIVKALRQKFRHLKTGYLFRCFDVAVVAISGFVFRDLDVALYALLAVLVSGKALDYVLYGNDEAKVIYIITDKSEQIGSRLLLDLDVGCTYLQAKGGWTGSPKDVIMAVVHQRTGPQVEEIVKAEDPLAFMIVSSASEIYGKGYKDLFAEKL